MLQSEFSRVRRPHQLPHLAKTTTPGQSVEQRIATLLVQKQDRDLQ
jgi:hypothetical protein